VAGDAGSGHAVRVGSTRRGWILVAAPVVAVLLALTACTSGSDGHGLPGSPIAGLSQDPDDAPDTDAPSQTESPTVPPAVITTTSARSVISPIQPISVAVAAGTLTSVKLRNPEGKVVAGELSADATSWKSTEVLGYSKTYTLSAAAVNSAGTPVTKTAKFTTLTPGNMTMPYLNTTAGQSLQSGATYGVGLVPVVHFDEQVTDRKAAEKALVVTTTPHVDGVWNWVDSQNVHWRPKTYLTTGTRVTVSANVYGVQVGPGLYGQADQSISFKIGAKHIAVADDKTHLVRVYFNGKVVRTMPTSMGMGGWVTGTGGQKISLWTMPGTYTVIGHENPAIMSSASFGLPANSPYGYAPEKVYQATKISTDGIYLHSAPWSVWAQGHSNQSHGCLNLSPENATWYFKNSQIGDVVVVSNTGGPKLQIWQNGDWSVPWATWVKGSALH
jgi:lipoprotein-anchoring transpeptidase ErfK/SrfK